MQWMKPLGGVLSEIWFEPRYENEAIATRKAVGSRMRQRLPQGFLDEAFIHFVTSHLVHFFKPLKRSPRVLIREDTPHAVV